MKKFDLEKAIAGHKLITRDGREITDFHYFKTSTDVECIRCVINSDICSFYEKGNYLKDKESTKDLFLKSEKKKLYVAIYKQHENSSEKWHINAAYSCTDKGMLKSRYDLSDKNWHIVEVEVDV